MIRRSFFRSTRFIGSFISVLALGACSSGENASGSNEGNTGSSATGRGGVTASGGATAGEVTNGGASVTSGSDTTGGMNSGIATADAASGKEASAVVTTDDAGFIRDASSAGTTGRNDATGDASAEANARGTTGGTIGGSTTTGGTTGGSTTTGGTTGGSNGTPGLRIVGRIDPVGSMPLPVRFSWPGVDIGARFIGTQVSMDLNDGNNKNRFTVVVDGGTPRTVTTTSGQTSLPLATGLPNGTHTLLVWRNTEASFGVTQFAGLSSFGNGGALLAPPPPPDRRIEVIGDSISVGAGDEGNAACPGGIDAFTNNYLAYGSVAARAVGADVVTIAWSGIGVYRNYDGSATNTMPSRYPYAIPNDRTAWDFSRYQPQVVVINLGTNDFGMGDPGTAYETAYVDFVKNVRAAYAKTYFILIDMYGGNRLTRIDNVVRALKNGGESNVEALSFSSVQNDLGCNQHPNSAGQAAMGSTLAARLRSLMGW